MNKPLLSICIPTYNREPYLKECLDSIVCQFNDPEIYNQVEIIISDNASNDDTEKVAREYKKRFNNITYYRNNTNLGYDRNVQRVVYYAVGDFIWTLSDDELIRPDSLEYLFKIFFQYPEVSWICIDQFKELSEVNEYRNGDDWLAHNGLTGGKISQNIYNKKYLPKDISRYFDNLWIHFSLAREVSCDKPQLLIKNLFIDPEVSHPCSWAGNGGAFFAYVNLRMIVKGLGLHGYNKKNLNKILRQLAAGLPRQVASARLHGLQNNYKNFQLIIKGFYAYPLYLLIATIVYYLPIKILLGLKHNA